jgi:hypothetical protein
MRITELGGSDSVPFGYECASRYRYHHHCSTHACSMPCLLPVVFLQTVIGLAAFWVVLGGIVGVAGFRYVNSKQIKDQP